MEDHDDPGRRSRKRIDSPIKNGLEKELSGTSKRFSKGIDEYRPFELKAKDDSEEQSIGEDQFTETIDLTSLFSKELSATGSFDIRGEIWESTFGQVLQALPIPVFLIGQDSKIIFANQACSKMSSAYEETQGVLFPTLFPGPGVSGKVELLLEDVFSSRKTKVAQAFLKIKENRIWARFTLRSVRIMRERQILALIEDLTSEKKQIRLKEKFSLELEQRVAERTAALWEAEAALHGSEERFKDLVESTSDWIWERDANGVYTYASPRIKELLGYEPEEVLGKVPSELMPSEKMSFQFDSELQSVVRTGKPFRSWETISESKDGRLVVIESSGVPFFDSTGKLLGYRGIDRDITHRKQTEEALHKSEEKYRLMADNTLDLIWQTDLDLCLTYVNPAIFAVTGYTPDEVIGSRLSDHCDEENFTKMAQVASEEISKGSESSGAIFEAVVLNKNKEPVPIEIRGKIVLDKNGAPIALQGVARDITYRKQAEDALRNSEEKYRL
ncbi:MAG: PAS domain-containing protein, partial [Desulfomonilaceae bacterium]